jgi:hypothetical protein
MKYLLDTDHLSIIQRETGQDYVNFSNRMSQHPISLFQLSRFMNSYSVVILISVVPITLMRSLKDMR